MIGLDASERDAILAALLLSAASLYRKHLSDRFLTLRKSNRTMIPQLH
jgi:hypothetical protein